MLCVWKIKGVVHDTFIVHGANHHLPYAVCMDDREVQSVIEHGVERHVLYAVSIENRGGAVCDKTQCGAPPAICSVCRKLKLWCMILSQSMAWSVSCHMLYVYKTVWRGAVCDRTRCVTSPAICCVYGSRLLFLFSFLYPLPFFFFFFFLLPFPFLFRCMLPSYSMVLSVACHMMCV